jgi:hypothetical protein
MVSIIVGLTPNAINAQAANFVPPAGSMMWHYQCKAGAQCPTKCTVQGNELFSTGAFVSLRIWQIPNNIYWFQLEAGANIVDFIVQSPNQFACTIAGATLVSAGIQARENSAPNR